MLDATTFDREMNRLKFLPTQGGFEAEEAFAARKLAYYGSLRDLDTDRFAIACQRLFSEAGRVWFPTPGEIRAEAEAWKPLALPAPPRTPEEIEAGKAAAREGLALIRAAVASRLMGLPPEPSRPRPKDARAIVECSDERRDLLRRQAQEIAGEDQGATIGAK